MSVNSKMTAIANKIRSLLGTSGAMSLDAMATNLNIIQNNISSAFTAIKNKGGVVPSSKVSGNLVSSINSIPSGITVQKKTGSFTLNTSDGTATVDCGFIPDLVVIRGVIDDSYGEANATFAKNEHFGTYSDISSAVFIQMVSDESDFKYFGLTFGRGYDGTAINGFLIRGLLFDQSFSPKGYVQGTLEYIAVKYT